MKCFVVMEHWFDSCDTLDTFCSVAANYEAAVRFIDDRINKLAEDIRLENDERHADWEEFENTDEQFSIDKNGITYSISHDVSPAYCRMEKKDHGYAWSDDVREWYILENEILE